MEENKPVEDVKLVNNPTPESELIADLKFLYYNRSDTVDLFLDEALSLFDSHVNERLAQYQERILNESTRYFQGELAGVLVRTRRSYRQESEAQKRNARSKKVTDESSKWE